MDHTVFLGLGANIGDRHKSLERAIKLIERRIGRVTRRSSFIETDPWGFESENVFLNAAVCVTTEMTPMQLLEATQSIEDEMGRSSRSANGQYHDRKIDIDILLYDDITVDTPTLKIPHPLMYERDFVMIPLQEILEE